MKGETAYNVPFLILISGASIDRSTTSSVAVAVAVAVAVDIYSVSENASIDPRPVLLLLLLLSLLLAHSNDQANKMHWQVSRFILTQALVAEYGLHHVPESYLQRWDRDGRKNPAEVSGLRLCCSRWLTFKQVSWVHLHPLPQLKW